MPYNRNIQVSEANKSSGAELKKFIDVVHKDAIAMTMQYHQGMPVDFTEIFDEAQAAAEWHRDLVALGGKHNFKASLPILLSGLESIIQQIKQVVPCHTYH